MTVRQMENAELKDVVYYIVAMWANKNCRGETFLIAYKRKINAKKRMNNLIQSGSYERVIMREEDVTIRNATMEISSSNPIEIWER